ncbi:TetR/AcrR family transcriptional regulator [Paucisalibacillus sp. EB02]|uniref:TetR/AcrR family transcriptional regulator n=1 Tax=Paucisalibacillus sp. EB02 TaxID=1347087 RepID=UPI0004BC46FE|nr:TetR/AcrR family transcriptional regulator [Paucisalibacillus sp. EB02]
MARLNEEQLKDIREERKIQIMTGALKVFANNGIKQTKISMIAKEAGVSHGLVYHYFDSKEAVLYDTLLWAMEVATIEQTLQELNQTELSPLEQIKFFLTFALKEGNSDIFRVVQHIMKADDIPQDIIDLVEQSGNVYIQFMFPLFVKGQELGEIIPGDTQELVEIFLNVLSGIIADDNSWWQENIERKIDILMRMVAVR